MTNLPFRMLGCVLLWAASSQTQIHSQNAGPAPKIIGLPGNQPESNPPSVSIEYPKEGQVLGESTIQTLVNATDDTRVEAFRFVINGTPITGTQGEWFWAPGMLQPWGTSLQLNPGANTLEVQCADYWGNMASTSVTFVYAVGDDLTLDIGNGGQVTPNYVGQSLQFGQRYAMTARPGKGFRFDGWSGSVSNRRPKLTFIMQTNLFFAAHFTDVSRPLNIIRFPHANRTVTNATVIASGKAADNSAVTNVYYQLNGAGWEMAITTNAWTNWETAPLSPVPGRNTLESCAMDDSGLLSRTNRVRFKY